MSLTYPLLPSPLSKKLIILRKSYKEAGNSLVSHKTSDSKTMILSPCIYCL